MESHLPEGWGCSHLAGRRKFLNVKGMKTLIAVIATAALVVGCSQQIKETSAEFNKLPPSVQKAVKSHAPKAEIASVNETKRDGMTVYEVEFADPGANPKMVFAADGTILRDDTTALGAAGKASMEVKGSATAKSQLSALPEPVRKTVQGRVGNAEIASVNKKDDNGRVIYEIEFKDAGKNPTMKVAADGTIVESLQK
jgi:uncharacterized membrane protein YkoI